MLPATFRQIEIFVLVAETGSFAAAADELGVSSAAISGHIAALEKKLKCDLFVRRPGSTPILTERGATLLDQSRGLLEQASAMADGAEAPRRPSRARVGTGPFILENIFLPRMAAFQALHPHLQVEFTIVNPNRLVEALRADHLDLAYASTFQEVSPAAELISTASQGLFARPDHSVVSAPPGTPLPMIMALSGSVLERATLQALREAGLANFTVVTRAQHFNTMMQLAEQGLGVCFAFHDAVADAVAQGRLVELEATLPSFKRWALRRAGALQVPHLRQLDDFLTDALRSGSVGLNR